MLGSGLILVFRFVPSGEYADMVKAGIINLVSVIRAGSTDAAR